MTGKTLYLEEQEQACRNRLFSLIDRLAIASPVVFDVGANVGQSIERFRSRWPSASIRSFEPNPTAFAKLRNAWGSTEGVALHNVGLGDSRATATFYATRESELGSLLQPTERMRTISPEKKYDYDLLTVPVETVDSFCLSESVHKIDVLKIDVQGAELRVLKGAEGLLRREGIATIFVETILADSYVDQTDLNDLLSYMKEMHYQPWDISPFVYTRNDRIWAVNSIFVSRSVAETIEARA